MTKSYAVTKEGVVVEPGDIVTDFRGDKAKFVRVDPNGRNRVQVVKVDADLDSFSAREYFPSVFDLRIVDGE